MTRLKKYSFTAEAAASAETAASAIVMKRSVFASHALRRRAEQSERLDVPIWKKLEEWGYGR